MLDENVGNGEQMERRGARPGPRRGPVKEQFTIRLTAEERDHLVGVWGWVQAGITALVRGSMEGTILPVQAATPPKKPRKKQS